MKKIFTLLTLALISIGSAWGADTDYVIDGSLTFTSGKCTVGGLEFTIASGTNYPSASDNITIDSKKVLKFSKKTYTITLPTTFKASKIYMEGMSNKKDNATNTSTVKIGSGTDETFPAYMTKGNHASGADELGKASATYSPSTSGSIEFTVSSQETLLRIVITGHNEDPAPPTCTTAQTTESATIGTALNLTATATHYSDLQWYKATVADLSDGAAISGATSATYEYTAAKADANKTYYFYCIASNTYATSDPKTAQCDKITVNVGSYTVKTASKLYEAKYSNGFNAFITEPVAESGTPGDDDYVAAANGKVQVYYLAGTTAPTLSSTELSADATANTSDASKIVVTAEDGTTKSTYDVTITAVTPFDGSELQFDGSESWIKTGNSYVEKNGDKVYYSWIINRQLKDTESKDTDARVAIGKTRIYFFVDAATSVTLINNKGVALNAARSIKVYVNGTEDGTVTSMGAYDATTPASITINTGAAAMIEISSNQNSGDTGWSKITVAGSKKTSVAVGEYEWATFVPSAAVDFTDSGVKAYIVTGATGTAIVKKQVNKVAAETPVLLNASKGNYEIPSFTGDADATTGNLLKAGADAAVNNTDNNGFNYVLSVNEGVAAFKVIAAGTPATVPTGKAYLALTSAPSAHEFLYIDGTVTGVDVVTRKALEENRYYNLQGQEVKAPRKGLYIVNGKKVIIK